MIEVDHLTIQNKEKTILDGVSLTIHSGDRIGVTGASGIGKSTLAFALLGELGEGLSIADGRIQYEGQQLLKNGRFSRPELIKKLRARTGHLDQDPASSLNPKHRIAFILTELAVACGAERDARIQETFAFLGLPYSKDFMRRYPQQLSGGQRRRVALARILLRDPGLLILDEPTADLDRETRDDVLCLLSGVIEKIKPAVFLISHDDEVIQRLTNRRYSLVDGKLVPWKEGSRAASETLLKAPETPLKAPETLLKAPEMPLKAPEMPKTMSSEPVQEVTTSTELDLATPAPTELSCSPSLAYRSRLCLLQAVNLSAAPPGGKQVILQNLSFDLYPNEALAITGSSGTGKTTLLRTILGIWPRTEGELTYRGEHLAPLFKMRSDVQRKSLGWVPQDPRTSFNPAIPLDKAFQSVKEPAMPLPELLSFIGLSEQELTHRFPDQLSGGQIQRLAIARSLFEGAAVLLLDEVTSSLDPRSRDSICDLLCRLKKQYALLLVTHDPIVVEGVCDRELRLDTGPIAAP